MVASPEILALESLRQKDPKPKTAPGNKLPNAMLWLRGKTAKAESDGTMSGLSQERLGNLLHWTLE